MALAKCHWDRVIGPKDLEAKGQLYHVGVCFEALCMGHLMAFSDFSCNFFGILTSGFEQCVSFGLGLQVC